MTQRIRAQVHPPSGAGNSPLRVEGRLYTNDSRVEISIEEGKIAKIEPLIKGAGRSGMFVAPGLIDMQINGIDGVDFSNPKLNAEDLRKAVKALWKAGVTTFLPTLITHNTKNLENSLSILAQAMTDPEIKKTIPGFHLEGPYISPLPGYRGAHLEKHIRPPDWNEFMALQQAAGQGIRVITLAPEIAGAIPFIRKCTESGVVVSLGHHNASADTIRLAIEAGACMSTHLGNGCANLIDRHINPLWPQLADDRITATLIADGFHLNQDEMQCFYKIKGTKNTILISDALDLAGLPPGEYVRSGRKVTLTPDVVKFPAENVLAGAVSPLTTGLSNMMKFTGCSLGNAFQMASTNAAAMLKLHDRGEIQHGKRADLIVFTLEDGRMVIHRTIVAGKVVYENGDG